MDTITNMMTDVLEELVESELKQFTRQLSMGVKPGVTPIPQEKLQNKDRQDVVDCMVQFYGEDAGKNTAQALRNIKQNERANRLELNLLKVQAPVQEDERKPKDPQPIQQPILQPIQQPIPQLIPQPIQQSIPQPIQQSIPHAIQQPIPQLIPQPIQQLIPQPILQTINTAGSEELQPIQSDWQRSLWIIPSNQEFKCRVLDEYRDNIYTPVSRTQRKGLALLITNIQFANDIRYGAERDEANMEWLLKSLGFSVIKYRNITGKQISRAVREFSRRHEHQDSDSTFVVIMSHGKRIQNRDAILGVNYDVYFVEDTFSHLNAVNCPDLIDKPKVILIQACRGGQDGGVYVRDRVHAKDSWVHKEKDFVCFMSTLPNNAAFRSELHGSYFINYIVDVFCSSACKDDIMELFRKVTLRMEKDPRFLYQKKLMPCIERTSIAKKFYLFPGL